jgi:hypothetical protein
MGATKLYLIGEKKSLMGKKGRPYFFALARNTAYPKERYTLAYDDWGAPWDVHTAVKLKHGPQTEAVIKVGGFGTLNYKYLGNRLIGYELTPYPTDSATYKLTPNQILKRLRNGDSNDPDDEGD